MNLLDFTGSSLKRRNVILNCARVDALDDAKYCNQWFCGVRGNLFIYKERVRVFDERDAGRSGTPQLTKQPKHKNSRERNTMEQR